MTGIITYGCMCPYKDPNDPRKKETQKKAYRKYYYKHHELVLSRKYACDKRHLPQRAAAMREYRKNNPDIVKSIERKRWTREERQVWARAYRPKRIAVLESKVFDIIPNRCYFDSKYCLGSLEWDHKYGDGKNDRHNKMSRLYDILKNPDKWMRLCRRHNGMKDNIPKDVFESMILEMSEKINDGRANHDL